MPVQQFKEGTILTQEKLEKAIKGEGTFLEDITQKACLFFFLFLFGQSVKLYFLRLIKL